MLCLLSMCFLLKNKSWERSKITVKPLPAVLHSAQKASQQAIPRVPTYKDVVRMGNSTMQVSHKSTHARQKSEGTNYSEMFDFFLFCWHFYYI